MNADAWVSSADRALGLACEQIRLIRAATPTNWAAELTSLLPAFQRGSPRPPQWIYDRRELPQELLIALERLAEFLEGVSPIGRLYADRARELCLEASMIHAVGTPHLRVLARQRFLGSSPDDVRDEATAHALALSWTSPETRAREIDPGHAGEERVRSCDTTHPSSLVSAMSREAGRAKLPMRVIVQPGLASLAATADGAILVASEQWLLPRTVDRTVLHEIAGHALPRALAAAAPLAIFAIGTARGVDDQEGRALLIEESAGYFDEGRRREIGLRHLAAHRALEGADFIDVVRLLVARGAPLETALRIAARVLRGGSGAGGLAREIVYVPAFIRVGRVLGARTPQSLLVERAMASGRVAVHAAPLLARFLKSSAHEAREVSEGAS